jgi:hypothetical protein
LDVWPLLRCKAWGHRPEELGSGAEWDTWLGTEFLSSP